MCFPWHHEGFSMASNGHLGHLWLEGNHMPRIAAPLFSTRAPQGLQGLQGLWAFWTTPCKDRSHLTCLQDKKPQITESLTWFVHRIAVAFENNFFVWLSWAWVPVLQALLVLLGLTAGSGVSLDGFGMERMRCVNKTADLTTGTSVTVVTPSFHFFCSWCVFQPFSRWFVITWSHPHEAIDLFYRRPFSSWPPWPLWPLGSTMPGQRICGGDWNRAPRVKSRRGPGRPPGSSDSICRTSDYVYIYIYIMYIYILSNLLRTHTHTHIYIYAYVLRCVVLKMYI